MSAIPVDAYVFDCGRVITCDWDRAGAAAMAGLLGAPLEDFVRAYIEERGEYDRGTMTAAGYWGRVGARFGAAVGPGLVERLVNLDMSSWFTINHDVVRIITGLRATGVRMLVLSNMNFEGKERMFGDARFSGGIDWTACFDSILLSCDLKLLKPERAIYRACVEAAGTLPDRCLFIDDNEDNVAAAREAGMHAVLFSDAAALSRTLARDYVPSTLMAGASADAQAHAPAHASAHAPAGPARHAGKSVPEECLP